MTTRLTRWLTTLDNFEAKMAQLPAVRRYGRLTRATGLVLEATGLQLPLGATCVIERQNGSETHEVESEVVGFNGQRLFLMPLEEVEGVLPGARVYAKNISTEGLQSGKQLPLGPALLGRVLDGSGKPLDGLPSPDTTETGALITPPFNPLQRTPIEHVLDTGVRPINALLTVGRGQRMGLFAGSGVGKSVLLGMMARYTRADVIVVGLIGERGREVKDFIENILGAEGRARSVVIAAPADVSPLLRMQGAAYATRIAEDFRDRGQHVLLIMDSLTRYAMAQREIALAIGEPPATKGYPPSVFAKLPALVERAGNGISGGGSITAFYTVLTEGDDQQDPIADSARAILDGHIVLSRRLAEAGHYPAIDIEASISRAMTALISEQHYARVRTFKQLFPTKVEGREFTHTEQRVINRMLKLALEGYSDAWKAINPLEVEYVRSEMQVKFTNITTSPNDIVVNTPFHVEIGNLTGEFNICLPFSMIEPLRELLVNPPLENSRNEDQNWRDNLVRQVQHSQLELVANFADISLRLSQILKLKPGDVLPIEKPDRIIAHVDGVPVLTSQYGTLNGQYALRIEHLINPILNSLNEEQPK
ncbi:flagellum-specific ATP synthase FliI [Escherichia coli]|nr:flagellum-specific ATP synthase FliI [Escherichia coli]EGD4707606.1 flagellum-specific ATP synthase FliL [Escherichia coli]STD49673.1 flagellum-specific ATP synthase [Escherichia coli]HAJ3019281.1 flagellum-specific ATP synthase FliI [Escherichia coli]HCX4674263.1 flagellum-specific ATP synthase FliI [Escherichia coli]